MAGGIGDWQGIHPAAALEDAEYADLACRTATTLAFAYAAKVALVTLKDRQLRFDLGPVGSDAHAQLVVVNAAVLRCTWVRSAAVRAVT